MGKFTLPLQKVFYVFLLLCWVNSAKSQAPVQTLKLSDFAVWGGSASSNSYNNSQGVTVGIGAIIQGNLGSNHLINVKNNFTLTGSIFSGNAVTFGTNGKITGDIFAAKNATNAPANILTGGNKNNFIGNLTAKGKIVLQSGIGPLASTITGKVAVPAPTSTNYSGPAPAGGIVNTVVLPVLPSMPNNRPFDNQVGTTNITNTQTISPGKYLKLALTGNKTLTFNGPGNYIFNEVDNGTSANKFVFDFNNNTTDSINIFIIKNAKWGKLSVRTVNGNFPSRIYTEVHGTGSTNGGFAFDLQSPGALSSGTYSWLGNVWAPNGGIAVKSFILSTSAQIVGALWSGTKVDLSDNLVLSYQAPGSPPPPPSPQTLTLNDFAVWGGSALSDTYNSSQTVTVGLGATIQGNIGSNHLINVKNNFTLTGSIFSGNAITLGNNGKITGDIFAAKNATNSPANTIYGDNRSKFIGNLTAKGKIVLQSGIGSLTTTISGKIAVPAPTSTNYSGPAPAGGIVNTVVLPVLPSMPKNTPFDNQVGTTNITNTQTISPGKYLKLALTGNKTLTFNGPGNYIFNEVDNGTLANKFIFDFKNTTTGTINIYIIKNAKWGKLSVNTVNGNFPSRIYTEIHGNGSTNSGFAFDLQSPGALSSGTYSWLGNVWAPNGGIAVKSFILSTSPQIVGALWSGTKVDLSDNLVLSYQAPAIGTGPTFIDPYYPPPTTGKVTAANNIIGAELLSLSQNRDTITSIPENEIFILDNARKVLIEVISKSPNDNVLKLKLKNMGMTDTVNNGPHTYVITGYFPIDSLPKLNGNTFIVNGDTLIRYVRPLYPPISNAGQVTTQGDTTMRSYQVRKRFGLDGSGVKIGVISDSYNSKLGEQQNVAEGDLPGNPEPVQVLADLQRGNDEGRAMLQIIHDVAPKAKLAFRTGFLTAGDFAKGIHELASPGLPGGRCDVIVDDITYVTEPFLRDGVVAEAVNEVVAQGVTYFSSAGNFGNKSYEANFIGVTNASVIPGQIHQFGNTPADIYQTVNLKPGTYTIVLQWSDEFHSLKGDAAGIVTDMDLYLLGTNGFTLFGFNRSNISGDPFEVCPFKVNEETNAKLMVVRAAGTRAIRFKYIILRGEGTILDYQAGASSIVGHPNADSAIAVGAMLYANIPPFTPVWPSVASFSSRGGTSTLKNNIFITRKKPELIGPNGVNTTVNLGGAAFNDGDQYPNFFGTSAAAPHVAAVGALLIQGRKKFTLDSTVTPYEIRQQLQTSTGKFTNSDSIFSVGGYGYVQADAAMLQIANARPIIDSLKTQIPLAQNGTDSFVVVIKGKYLTDSTKIYVNGMPVATNVTGNKTQATAKVPDILPGEDPPFQLFNPPKRIDGEDGGLSEALHFFSSKIDITIKAVDTSRKYGQSNPGFRAEIFYNGELINDPDTLTKLKLNSNNISFTTIATSASNAGLYGIFPSRPLANNDPLLSRYGFTFVSGTLKVGKMSLKITPQNDTIRYGEYPGDIVYKYELDESPADSLALVGEIKTLHKKYLADNGLVVINGFNNQNPAITQSDLANMSTMASFQSVRNARKFVLENGQLKAVVNVNPSQIGDQRFIVDVSAQSLQNYKSDPETSVLVQSASGSHARGFLNIKALANETAKASFNGQLQPMVNGQLLAMVNGQLQAVVNGQLKAMVNGILVTVEDIVFQNGQLLAMVNGVWVAATNGQLQAVVNGQQVTVNLSVSNGQLQAVVNGQLMAVVNGQLQAVVNGQLLAVVNGQLKAVVNGQLMPMVNGQLQAMVNGQLLAVVNGQLKAVVNGQLLAVVNGELQIIGNLILSDSLRAVVNGQLKAVVNGQLKAMVNGVVTDIPTTGLSLVNGQLQAVVNGQLLAMVNGQLQAMVNGQLEPLPNNFDTTATSNNTKTLVLIDQDDITLQAGDIGGMFSMNMITGLNAGIQTLIPGAFVNDNFEVTYGLGQVKILPAPLIVKAKDTTKVYGDDNPVFSISYSGFTYDENISSITPPDTTCAADNTSPAGIYPITLSGGSAANYTLILQDGELEITKRDLTVKANDATRMYGGVNPPFGITATGFINGDDELDIDALPGFSTPANANSLVGDYPIDLSGGSDNNYNFLLQPGVLTITKAQLTATADNKSKVYGEANPAFTVSYTGFLNGDNESVITQSPVGNTLATAVSAAGNYPIELSGGLADNYSFSYTPGILTVTQAPLIATADDKSKAYGAANPVFTISYSGFVNGDNSSAITIPPVASTTATTNSVAGTYPITLTGGSSINYFISYVSGTLTIIGKPTLTVTAENKTKTQGEPNPTFTISYNGFVNGEDENNICSGSLVSSYIVPPSPVSIEQLGRVTNYTNVILTSVNNVNNIPNVITVAPGTTVTLTGNRSSSMLAGGGGCTGCVTQHYIGIRDVFSDCFNASGSSGALDHTFKAPKIPGVYYITQTASWEYNCFDNGSGNPDNNPANAIAVVIVEGINKLYATTSATTNSGTGNYPITITGCLDIPNYDVVYNLGTLTIQEDLCLELHWDANRTYTDRINNVAGTATGGVTNGSPTSPPTTSSDNPGKVGGVTTPYPNGVGGQFQANNSFKFNGTGTGYISTGTDGSVAGTGDFSVSAWVQTTSNDPMVIINQRGSDNGNYPSGFDGEYILKIGGDHTQALQNSNAGKAYFIIYDFVTGGGELFSTTLVNDGNWHQIKGERIGTTIRLYIDGMLEASTSTAGVVILNTAIPTYIGADVRDNASYFNGLIDDIRVSICPSAAARLVSNSNSTPVAKSDSSSVTHPDNNPAENKLYPNQAEDKLYPNPASSVIRLQLKDDVQTIKDIKVYNGVGQLTSVASRRISNGSYEINVSGLMQGIYIIEARTAAGIKTFKFIKM